MRYDVMVTSTAKYSFAVEATSAVEAQTKALTEWCASEPDQMHFETEVERGVQTDPEDVKYRSEG